MYTSFKALALSLAIIVCNVANAQQTTPFPPKWNELNHSEIDLSRFLDSPAGKHGFVKAEGEQLVDGAGNRLRLWGVNLGGPACFPSHDDAERLADTLARLGINVVRFHGLDSAWGRSSIDRSTGDTSRLNEVDLERFDYLLNQLRLRGIYGNINLNVFRTYSADDGLPNHEDLGLGKWATHFYPRMIELQKKYARDLLTHRNPYTGRTYADDPAVVVVEIVNENSLIEGWFNGRLVGDDDDSSDTWSPLPTQYAAELNRQFNRWLGQNRSESELASFRAEIGAGVDEPLVLLQPNQFRSLSAERFAADYEFILNTERAFLKTMKDLIVKEVGLRSMLIGDADHSDSINGYPHMANNRMFDYMDGHGYWQHPRIGNVTQTKNDAMVNDPADSTVVQFARTPMVVKPFVISETNHPYPHIYASEGIPIVTAYAMLQDWDGIVYHQWGDSFYKGVESIPKNGWFQISSDPVKVSQMMFAGLMWHRGDVDAAKELVIRSMTTTQMRDRSRAESWKLRPFFDERFPKTLPLVHRTRWQLSETAIESDYPKAPPSDDILSDTEQLRWHSADQLHGRVVIDTSRTQGLVGFQRNRMNHNHPGSSHLSADLKNEFASVLLTSLDDKPIRESKRMLLCVSDRAANQDLTWHDDFETVAQWGDGPVAIRGVEGRISLWGLGSGDAPKVTVLGSMGERTDHQWPVTKRDGGWHVSVGKPAALMAIIER